MKDQFLRPRTGYNGLTNRACVKWDDNSKCIEYGIINYDLNDPGPRKDLVSFGFICMVGSKRYKICKDRAGLCHTKYDRTWVLFKKKKIEYIPISDYQYLIDAGTTCYSKDHEGIE